MKCILKAYDGGTFRDAQQATRDNHGQMGEDSSRMDRGQVGSRGQGTDAWHATLAAFCDA